MSYFSAIETVLSRDPHRELLTTTDDRVYTCGDALAETAKMANALKALGAIPGDRITVQVDKSVGNLWLFLACLRAGFVFHPLNPAYQRGEVEYFVGDAQPAVIICDPAKREVMDALARDNGIAHVWEMDSEGNGSFVDLAARQPDQFETARCEPDETAALLYSSGTTGRPKGIMLTHRNLQSNAEVLVDLWGFTAQDRLLHCLPIFHVHGLFVALGCVLLSGANMRWSPAFSPAIARQFMPECTVLMGVPTFYTRLLGDAEFNRTHCARARLFISGSAPLLVETFDGFEARTGHRILERYGMTETGMNTSNPLHGERRPGTVGLPIPGTQVRVVDDADAPLPPGEVGNLQVRGPNVFKAYWRMPEKTAEDFREGRWFDTGDQAQIDADGYVSIVGRSKDMVISGGLNVYPKEVEDVLNALHGVEESAVIGVPHPDFGEAVVAVIVPSPGGDLTVDSVIAHARAELSNFKVPKLVELVDALPRNTMGKVQKKALREKLAGTFAA